MAGDDAQAEAIAGQIREVRKWLRKHAKEVRDWQKAHRWTPHQLRHTRATELRKLFGLDAAQVMLGHASADTTEIYAEANHERAREIAGRVG